MNNAMNCKKSGEIPLLMLPHRGDSLSFLDISKGGLVRVNLPEDPHPDAASICGPGRYFSSRGWLFKIIRFCDGTHAVTLVHPFSRLQLNLPSVETLVGSDSYENYFHCEEGCFISFILTKFVLSNPSQVPPAADDDSSLQVMLIYGRDGNLCYARPGDQVWRKVNNNSSYAERFVDAVYFQNRFYAINASGRIFSVDNDRNAVMQVAELPAELIGDAAEYLYMVESGDDGELFVVSRRGVQVPFTDYCYLCEENTYRTSRFDVFKVNLVTSKWSKMESLGRTSLFLGFNSSLSIDVASNNDLSRRCKPNCIYFTDDFIDSYWYLDDKYHVEAGGKDTGIYHMEDGSIEPLFRTSALEDHPFNPLMWVEQS